MNFLHGGGLFTARYEWSELRRVMFEVKRRESERKAE